MQWAARRIATIVVWLPLVLSLLLLTPASNHGMRMAAQAWSAALHSVPRHQAIVFTTTATTNTIMNRCAPPRGRAALRAASHSSDWKVGDAVFVTIASSSSRSNAAAASNANTLKNNDSTADDDAAFSGIIREDRGRGWYSVAIGGGSRSVSLNGKNETTTIKCRSTQLRRADAEPEDAAAAAANHRRVAPSSSSSAASATTQQLQDATFFSTDSGSTITTRTKRRSVDDAANEDSTSTSSTDPSSSSSMPPTIENLDALLLQHRQQQSNSSSSSDNDDNEFIRQLHHFATYDLWVVFSDLHCGPDTLDTCLAVLRRVHVAAQERRAGIAFLGDFWHVRTGTLRVDCLNAVLETLEKTFTQPMILIPGNHDQTRWTGGPHHALNPLRHAYRIQTTLDGTASVPGLLILSQPTVFLRALWIPHLKPRGWLEAVLQQSSQSPQSSPHALFCHVDVSGASMNDNVVSHGGVAPSVFADHHPNVPVYTGHFHKPHTVGTKNNNKIHYVGSPYQVSLAEAHQSKALLVLDAAQDWSPVGERIPLDVGRRHFRPASLAEFLELSVEKEDSPPTHQHENNNPLAVRAGDRVVFSIDRLEVERLRRGGPGTDAASINNRTTSNSTTADTDTTSSNVLDEHASVLRAAGVRVEVREIPRTVMPAPPGDRYEKAATAEDAAAQYLGSSSRTVSEIWSTFVHQQAHRGVISNVTRDELLEHGRNVLEGLHENGTAAAESSSRAYYHDGDDGGGGGGNGADLQLHTVTLQGFGPFRESVTYPLLNRGLVLLRGSNEDDGGADRYARCRTTEKSRR